MYILPQLRDNVIMGSKWEKSKDNDKTHTVWDRSNASRADMFVEKKGDDKHCHLWVNKDKELSDKERSGVVHRGSCKVCDDQKKTK